ncbi:MAG: TATA-box-binding protein [Candidatus Bathyarchaeia archaeon]
MSRPKPSIRIENVVASVNLNQGIDLLSVVKALPGAVEYKPEQFPGLVFRLRKPKTTTLIFSSGKMVCTGARSSDLARKAVRRVVSELRTNGVLIVSKPDIQVQNIVASVNLGGKVDLERSTFTLGRTLYEPEQFPGLIFRMDEPRVVILIFASGKLVCTGAKREQEVTDAVDKLKQVLEDEQLIYYEEGSVA